ncbi:BspA family leucine-rich repeat surface protein [Candidatus Saccharibacteria bacterium]|nr:BspA family leucine-rich repeat surface protein [Candidatus Saccharibacteria bacterium]
MNVWNGGLKELFCTGKSHLGFLLLFVVFLIFSSLLFSHSTYANSSITLITDESVVLNMPGGGGSAVASSNINVITTCRAGYTLVMNATSTDNHLYLNGDSTYSTQPEAYISPSDGTTPLKDAPNTWGYSMASPAPTIDSIFAPVPDSLSSPAILKTPTGTASETDIDDYFSIYFGVSTSSSIYQGSYRMPSGSATESGLSYLATVDPSCDVANLDVTFNANAGSDPVSGLPSSSDVVISDNIATLPSNIPTRTGYTFLEWNTSSDGTGNFFRPGDTITIGTGPGEYTGTLPLYAIWVADCPTATVCYHGNHADAGAMDNQTSLDNATIALIPSNFSRAGYGFAGWSTDPYATVNDSNSTIYGPNQNFTVSNSGPGTNVYAVWVAPIGTLQTWANPNSLNVGDVIALRDNRDDEVYTVAKLADNNVWITENLRLVPDSNVEITTHNTNSPTSNFLSGYPSSSPSDMCSNDNTTCDDSVQYNTNNINRNLTPQYNVNDNASSWYSYGVMYNWYTATAGNGLYSRSSGSVDGDLCPAGWHLPTGGSGGEWGALNTAVNSGATKSDTGLRTYPVNIIRSGDYNNKEGGGTGRGTQGRIWSATAASGVNAYRMGYSASDASATAKSWNKWDGFAIRCIYQGGNIPYADVDVVFSGTGIESLTFTNPSQPTETATPGDPSVSLAEDTLYAVTATTSTGYEVYSWASTSGGTLGDSITADPAINPNTYTLTDDATLTVTGQEIPSYTVTATIPEHVTSISFTDSTTSPATVITINSTSSECTSNNNNTYICEVDLKRGVEYTVSATFEEGYTVDTWTTGVGGTLGNPTSSTTTYTITSATTLSLTTKEAEELTYTLNYSAGSGTDAPDSVTETSYHDSYSFVVTNSAPIYYGYTFLGWSEASGATTPSYVSGDTYTVTSTGITTTKTLYAVYQANTCPANKICYYDNGADVTGGGRGTMNNQSTSSSTSANLIPPNYSKTGYGFAGWDTITNDANNNNAIVPSTTYGPNATITTPDTSTSGLALYAKWVKAEGELQSWRGCNVLSQGSVTALTDTRDNQTYAVAKLADDNCWIIENLRLDPGTAEIAASNTHNPTSTFITQSQAGGGASLSTDTMCNSSDDDSCINQIQYNANSLNRSLTPSHNTASSSVGWYSYGVYYNWYTATAGNGTYSMDPDVNVVGDICPSNWHLPTGNTTGEYNALNTAINNGATNTDVAWRNYPNNFVWSGDYNTDKRTSGYSNGRIWTATTKDNPTAYRIGYKSNEVTSRTNSFNKWDGFAVRCIKDETAAAYHDVTVTLPQNVSSIVFTNAKYGTETATTSNPTVSLAENATYTITANIVIGYELDEWTAGQNATIGSTTQNPTTLTITDDSTLTLSVNQIPSYQVTVNFTEGVSSIGFYNPDYGTHQVTTSGSTVTLYNNIPYTISSSYTGDYTIDHWSTTENGTLASTTSKATTYTVTGTATLTLTSKEKTGQTTLLPGSDLNTKMKTLAEGTSTSYDIDSTKIKVLHMADSLPEGFTPSSDNTVSVSGSEKPIYIYFDNTNNAGIMYFYTDAKDIHMNEDSNRAFMLNSALTDISALSSWSTSSVTNMSEMFRGVTSLTNIDALANWDVSSVTDMGFMFRITSLTNIDALANWDVSSVTDMSVMFDGVTSLTNIDALANWDVSSVTDMGGMFSGVHALTNIDALANWDVSSVTDMGGMFSSVYALTNIDALANWDVSSVTDMSEMFGGYSSGTSLTNIDALVNWDVSSVTDMSGMFSSVRTLTNIDALVNWDVSSVTDMSHMFKNASALTNIDGAANWDTSSVRNMDSMFKDASALTNIDGAANWNTSNVMNMSNMFEQMGQKFSSSINSLSAINNWNVRKVIATANDHTTNNKFHRMFGGVYCKESLTTGNYCHPNFSTRSGTWYYNDLEGNVHDGTFVPNNTTSSTITTTVKFDSHISGIKFYGVFPGSYTYTTQTISTSGSTISLNLGNSYQITATLSSGYELALWNPGEHGKIPANRLTINSRTNDPTYFIPTGDTTLTATSQPVPSDVTTTVNMDSNIKQVSFCNDKYNTYNSSIYNYDCAIATSNASTVTLKQGATYRVTTATNSGYEVSSYIATGATITSTAGPHTDFTPSGNSTLSVISTTNAPTHTVTVSMDSNISYVTFTSPDWPARTAIRNGSTVDLRENTPYTATAYTKNGYILSSWSTSGGSLSSTVTNPTTYTIINDSTLTVNSQTEPTNTHTVTVNLGSNIDKISFYNASYGTSEATSSSNTIDLKEGVAYIITATLSPGYELDTWSTTSGGTLSSTTDNPTVYTLTNDATLTLTSKDAPNYTITVNIDQGVSSVGFYNADYGTQQVTTSGSTVSLRHGVEYIITATFNDANLDSWSTTSNGTLGSTTSSTTTYTVTGTATLTLTSKEKTGQSTLLPGMQLNARTKTLAEEKNTSYSANSSKIKALHMANSLPEGFTPSSANTVSVDGSEKPIYIFFDNANDAGIMYFYTDAKDIYMNEDSSYAFYYNTALADISVLSSWDTSDVTNMRYMFSYTTSLTDIDALSSWDTSSVTDMSYMFMFYKTTSLTNIDGATNWDTSSVTDMSHMFKNASSLTNIDGASGWDTGNVTDMSGMFRGTSSLTSIEGTSNWNTSKVTTMREMFGCDSAPGRECNNPALTNIDGATNWDTSSVTDMSCMFYIATSLVNIDALANWDTSSVTDMYRMFYDATSLTNIDGAINWDTSSVTDMSGMFSYATSLTNIDGASGWNTSNVTDMSGMFSSASSLTNIGGASGWNTSSVTSLSHMFNHATSLTNIDGASGWNTSNVTDMSGMFVGDINGSVPITNINALANWDTGSVRYMDNMFEYTTSLTNTSGANNWDIRNVEATAGSSWDNHFYYMFNYTGRSSTYHPNFTKRSGTWNQEGTFIPGDTTSGAVTVTVNFDSHISNIKFYGIFPGSSSSTTQTVSSSGSTISLNRGYSYRITATLSSGYELALWDPGEHGVIPANRLTINSRSNDYTNFTPTGDTTLTATSQPIPNDVTTTVNMDSNVKQVSFCNDKYNTYNSLTSTYDCAVATTNGSTVTLKQGATYEVTTTTKQGYEVSSYTATGATITNTTGPHTDFTPSGNSTLSITSTTNAPTHTVTVNMDSNVSYVTFTNPDWPSKTAIRNGSTVDLRENTPYTATAYTASGYELGSWATSINGTLSSTTSNPTIYTITGNSTLIITSQNSS